MLFVYKWHWICSVIGLILVSSFSALGLDLDHGKLILNGASERLQLNPVVFADGNQFIGRDCQKAHEEIVCKTGAGVDISVVVNRGDQQVSLKVSTDRPVALEGLGFTGVVTINGPRAVFSHGFQSWSLSGWTQISEELSLDEIRSLLRENDENRKGSGLSREIGVVATGSGSHLVMGVLQATRLKSWVSMVKDPKLPQTRIWAVSGLAGESISLLAGESFSSDVWFYHLGESDLKSSFRTYAGKLDYFASAHQPKVGWNSWYYYWNRVKPDQIMANANELTVFVDRKLSGSLPNDGQLPGIVIDDGWQKSWGDWVPNKEFADLAGLREKIDRVGLEPGIWIAPFLVDKKADIAAQHPNWFVKETEYVHPTGRYYILDTSHPEVLEHIKKTIRYLIDLGFKTLKIDFLIAATYEGERFQDVTGLEAYHLGLQAIREAAGPSTYLIASGAPTIASFPYVDSWRIGPDIAFEYPTRLTGPAWTDVAVQARNISARWFFCDRVHCDADPLLLRRPHSLESQKAAASVIAFAGGGLHFSENLMSLSEDRKELQLPDPLVSTALSGQASYPEPLFDLDQLDSGLVAPNIFDRSFNNNRVKVPNRWVTPGGYTVLINFDRKNEDLSGTLVPGRSSQWSSP